MGSTNSRVKNLCTANWLCLFKFKKSVCNALNARDVHKIVWQILN